MGLFTSPSLWWVASIASKVDKLKYSKQEYQWIFCANANSDFLIV